MMLVAAFALAGAMIVAPRAASAEGLFDFLFGGLQKQQHQAPPQASFFADPFGNQPRQRRVRTASSGSGPAFCVRSCDGRYFPLSRNNASPVQICQAFCPASPTKVFFGSNIDGAIGGQWRTLCRQRKRLCVSQGPARGLHLQRPRFRRPRPGRSDARHLAARRRRDRHHRRPGRLFRRPARQQPDRRIHAGGLLSRPDRRSPRPARRDEGRACEART